MTAAIASTWQRHGSSSSEWLLGRGPKNVVPRSWQFYAALWFLMHKAVGANCRLGSCMVAGTF